MENQPLQISQVDPDQFISNPKQQSNLKTYLLGAGVVLTLALFLLFYSNYSASNQIKLMDAISKKQLSELIEKELESSLKQFKGKLQHANQQIQALQTNYKQINSETRKQQKKILNRVHHIEKFITFLEQKVKEDYNIKKTEKFAQMFKNSLPQDQNIRNSLKLSSTNIDINPNNISTQKSITDELKIDYDRLSSKYQFNKYPTEVPFCVLISTYNNINNWRFQYNIHSVLTQNYTNYRILIIDDASTDDTSFMIKRYLKKHRISDKKVKIMRNSVKKTELPNIYYTAHKFCLPQDKMIIIDGSDQLIGKQIFKTLSAVYQSQKSVIVYSNLLTYNIYRGIIQKWPSSAYPEQKIKNNLYREMDVKKKISQLRTFSVEHFRKIKEQDLKDQAQNFFTANYDEAIFLPMAEMSCGKMTFINEYFYLYYFGKKFNQHHVQGQAQAEQDQNIRTKLKKYSCLKEMSK